MNKEPLKLGKLYAFVDNRSILRFIVAYRPEVGVDHYSFLGHDGVYWSCWGFDRRVWEEVETDNDG